MAAVSAVGRPLLHLPRIERGLGVQYRGAPQARGLARHGIGVFRLGQIAVKRQPKCRTGPGRTAGCADTRLVDVPFRGLAADKLQCPRGIVQGQLHSGRQFRDPALHDITVADGNEGNSRRQTLAYAVRDFDERFVAAQPAAAVNVEHHRRWPGRRGLPKIEHLPLVLPVGDVPQCRGRRGRHRHAFYALKSVSQARIFSSPAW